MHPDEPVSTRRRLLLGSAALALPLAGCGGGLFFESASMRFVNGSVDDSSIDAYVDGRRRAHRLGGKGQVSDYASIDSGSVTIEFTRASDTPVIASTTVTLDDDEQMTALLVGTLSQRSVRYLRENNGDSASGETRLRAFHGAAGTGAVDIYLTLSTASLASATPALRLTEFGQLTEFMVEKNRTRRIRITEAGKKDVVLFDADNVALLSRETATLAVVSGQQGSRLAVAYLPEGQTGGALVNSLA